MKKILITGSRGFIGRHFWRALEDNELTGIDIKEGNDCRDFFKTSGEKFDLVIHCAAIVGGRLKIENEPLSIATDLSIDAEMFNWAIKTRPGKVVYFSSSAVYPVRLQRGTYILEEEDLDLEHIDNPDVMYGWSKLSGEMIAKYARKMGLDVYVFRPASGYGEDQDLDYPFPSLIKRIKDREDPFEIWGTGEQTRDFIHVDDIVGAVLKAIEINIDYPVNLSRGEPISFNALARMMFEISGFKPEIKHLLDKPMGVFYRVLNPSKMLSFYRPRIGLLNGITRALNL